MATTNTGAQMSDEQLREEAKAMGAKLGIFISALNAPQEVKDSLLNMLPQMNLEQLMRFTGILESKFLANVPSEADAKLRADLEKIKADFEARRKEINEETLNALNDLEDTLPNN